MWCDGFDADLLAVVPGASEAIGDAASLLLWTHSRLTDGQINCPSAWHTDTGMASYFSTRDRSPVNGTSLSTSEPLVRCTLIEALRDEWVHGADVVVDGHRIGWPPHPSLMEKLMYDVRGWTVLPDGDREAIRDLVRGYLVEASTFALTLDEVDA